MDLAVAAMAGIAVLWVPGAIVTRLLRIGSRDSITRLAHEFAIGLSFWPLLFLATSSIGIAWNAIGARAFFGALVVMLIVLWRRDRRVTDRRIEWIAVAIIAIVAFTRWRHIDGVVLPLWVDSVHHTMIVRLLVDHGRLPESYAPFIPQSAFYYHWGFHAVGAFVSWISGLTEPAEIPRMLLGFGQLLNVLTFFAVYCAAAALLRNRRAALLAATLATLVSLFPAYYVSWGRYTQLAGLLLLPPLAASFWKLGRHPHWRRAMEVAIVGAGMLLIHARVTVVFAILAMILVVLLMLQRKWNGLAWCGAAGVVALLLASPWIVHLLRAPQVRMIVAPDAAERARWETSHAVRTDIVWAPHNTLLFGLASGGLLGFAPFRLSVMTRVMAIAWWLLLVLLLQRRATRKRRGVRRHDWWRIAIVGLWILITALLINLDRFGLPRMRVVTNSAAAILLFLPLSVIGAHLLRWAADELLPASRRRAVMLAVTLLIAVIGAATTLHIVNPTTVLATGADLHALEWIRSNTPPRARFAVGVQPWIGGSYIGIDGGYWIPLVAERDSILPPGLYPWVMPADRVTEITNHLGTWQQAEQASAAEAIALLRAQGVTHVYFGARNETPLRMTISASPEVTRVYGQENVEIYALR